MKRSFNSSDSLTHFISQEEMNRTEEGSSYNREFQAMLDGSGGGDGEDYSLEETGQMMGDRKRRLSNFQVKSLEKIFEVDNKLDPDRKVKVAQDLGLQPRQVAIWFQNRRARWKTKQLEKDYNHLKANYDALKLNYHKLEQEKETLTKQLLELKAKLEEETPDRNEFHNTEKTFFLESDPTHTNHEIYTSLNMEKTRKLVDLKDGSSDSDSSGVLTEENITTSNLNLLNMSSYDLSPLCSSSAAPVPPANYLPFLDSRTYLTKAYQQQQSMKLEDQFLISNSEESCNIFSVDQAPNLCWYFSNGDYNVAK